MKNNLWTKGIVIGILVLFVGINILPIGSIKAEKNQSSQSIQIQITDDDWGNPTDNQVDIPAYLPDTGITPTLDIHFTITGTNTTETTAFYGDDPWEDWKNISIQDDILYPMNDSSLYHVGTEGDWICSLTPSISYPTKIITLGINWPGNGSANNSIQIINGSYVTPRVDSFPWGQDYNLTITVRDLDQEALKYADLYLIWEEDDVEFNHTQGENTVGNGRNGEYTFWITKEDQGENIQKNITIAVTDASSLLSGYTTVLMNKPTPLPELEINTMKGGFGLKVQMKNNGTIDATNVTLNITFSGAWMMLPPLEHYQTIFNLGSGATKDVTVLIFGLGTTTITIDATCSEGASIEKTATGTVFLFFLFGIK